MVQLNVFKFHNMEALQSSSTPEESLLNNFRKMNPEKACDKLEMLYNSGFSERNNIEHRYALLYKAVCLCDHLRERSDVKTSCNLSQRICLIMNNSMNELERLHTQIRQVYELYERKHTPLSPPPRRLTVEDELNSPDFGNFIPPKKLVKYVEEDRKCVLIIDFRHHKIPGLMYKDENFIRVLPLDDRFICPGLIFNHIQMHIEVRYRYLLMQICNYDLIVLMGDELADPNGTPFSVSSKCKLLLDAIVTFNPMNPVKRQPLMMQGGFPAWENAYPMYVERGNEHRHTLPGLDRNDEFSELVRLAGMSVRGISYPDLSEPKPKSAFLAIEHESKHDLNARLDALRLDQPRYQERKAVVRNVPIRIEGRESSPTTPAYSNGPDMRFHNNHSTISSSSSSTQLSDRSKDRSPPAPKARPLVDRSNKPHIDSHLNNTTTTTEFPVEPSDSKKSDPNGTAGGARVDVSGQADNQVQMPRRIIARPPTPDRSTKKPMANLEHLNTLTRLYEMSVEEISKHTPFYEVPFGYTGLQNMGNTCFMNATLQALFNTPCMRRYFTGPKFRDHVNTTSTTGTKGIMTACFSALMDVIWSRKYKSIKPERFMQAFASVCPSLADRKQHDAQEFLIYLLDALHEDTNRVLNKKNFEQNYDGRNIVQSAHEYLKNAKMFWDSPVRDIFNMTCASQLKCQECGTASLTFEELYQITLELPVCDTSCALFSCLFEHFKDTTLTGTSCWNCPKCKRPQTAQRSSKIWTLPNVLVIHMKRFSMSQGSFEKNNVPVDFEIDNLDMQGFLHPEAEEQNSVYKLYAITNHDGSLNSGHYTSFVFNAHNKKWLKFDDEVCSEVKEADIKTKKAFILYYTNDPHSF